MPVVKVVLLEYAKVGDARVWGNSFSIADVTKVEQGTKVKRLTPPSRFRHGTSYATDNGIRS